ncbi:hypothetical protein WG68_02050 [Arsukibacterium ikkense]|uniref:Uncharacterized protein n=1 Tax=Arsukibacterium ikkense TaxID=336831 RepID=A0A0M2V7E6_9GAMM|nr:hypothetical protein [Arsukibacterium ikkense]KKO46757.1 hypothetical protein WG68_02050 [Arsukibacterium ikkense]
MMLDLDQGGYSAKHMIKNKNTHKWVVRNGVVQPTIAALIPPVAEWLSKPLPLQEKGGSSFASGFFAGSKQSYSNTVMLER